MRRLKAAVAVTAGTIRATTGAPSKMCWPLAPDSLRVASRSGVQRIYSSFVMHAEIREGRSVRERRQVMSSNKPMKVEHTTPKTMAPWERAFGFPMLARLSDEFDSMFGRVGLDRPMFEPMPSMWNPEMEIITKAHELLVKVDMPGIKKDEVTVEIADDHLVLRGERKQEKEEKKDGFFKTERTYGSFFRMVPLPEGVKSEGAKAIMHDGVLEITVPMVQVEEKRRTLAITEPAPVKATKAA